MTARGWLVIFWWSIAICILFCFGYFLAEILDKPKPVKSRHAWYTISGALSRVASYLALRWANNPNDFFPIAVFAYGMVELFGTVRTVTILRKFHARIKKVQQKSRVSVNSSAAPGSVRGGPHV